jgi:hypothetical protein
MGSTESFPRRFVADDTAAAVQCLTCAEADERSAEARCVRIRLDSLSAWLGREVTHGFRSRAGECVPDTWRVSVP